MPRVPYLAREDLPLDKQRLFDDIAEGRGHVPNPFKLLANSPDACAIVSALGQYVRFRSGLPTEVREIAFLTVSREINCQYTWTVHEPRARQAGISDAAVEALRHRTTLNGLPPHEIAVIRYARSVVRHHRVSDASFQAIHKMLGTRGAVDLTMAVSYYMLLGRCMDALGVELEPGAKPLLPSGSIG